MTTVFAVHVCLVALVLTAAVSTGVTGVAQEQPGGRPMRTNTAAATGACTSALNCSLFGDCRGGACVCDAGWGGPACATMQLLPVSFPQGYGMARSLQADVNTSWGGNVIASGGKYHMFVNSIANQCLLGSWMINSRIDHVVSDTVTGPYTYRDTAVAMTSSNPAPVVLKPGGPHKYAIFHIFNGTTAAHVNVPQCFQNGSRMPPHHHLRRTGTQAPRPNQQASAGGGGGASHAPPPERGGCGPGCDCDRVQFPPMSGLICIQRVAGGVPGGCCPGEGPQRNLCLDNGTQWPLCASDKGRAICPGSDTGATSCAVEAAPVAPSDPPVITVAVPNSLPDPEPADGVGADWRDHQISVSDSLDGPWTLLQPTPGNKLPVCNNPAPWVHPNGTLYAMCGNRIYTADTVDGPWRNVTSIINPGNAREWPQGWHHEDQFLFTTKRGWHVLFHADVPKGGPGAADNCTGSVVSAHMFSADGFDWHVSPVSPYGNQVEVEAAVEVEARGGRGATSTRTVTVATRERPKIVFDAAGEMTHLINGVCGAASCTDSTRTGCMDCKYHHWDYTLIQPIRRPGDPAIRHS